MTLKVGGGLIADVGENLWIQLFVLATALVTKLLEYEKMDSSAKKGKE